MADILKKTAFKGFSMESLYFLKGLALNNHKVWFEANREDFEITILEPMRKIIADLGDTMLSIDPLIEIRPHRSISRIYRDTRFSKDKSPYKTTLWITFKRPGHDWQGSPAYFFELYQDSYRYGMGFYNAEKRIMDKLREMIDTQPQKFRQAVSFYNKQKTFDLQGECYKRKSNNDLPEDLVTWYQRKSFYLVCHRDIDVSLFSSYLIDDLSTDFKALAPFYHFLWALTES